MELKSIICNLKASVPPIHSFDCVFLHLQLSLSSNTGIYYKINVWVELKLFQAKKYALK